LEIRSLNNARTARAKKGKVADLGIKPTGVVRVEWVCWGGLLFICLGRTVFDSKLTDI